MVSFCETACYLYDVGAERNLRSQSHSPENVTLNASLDELHTGTILPAIPPTLSSVGNAGVNRSRPRSRTEQSL